jgi:pSer/pThr/pTyr-binding forkhead associated (FHA) protein
MSDTARITVTSGPDKGRVYELTGEMIRLGRSPENNVVFTDTQVEEQHASIVCREGRFAIHTLLADGLEIDGTEVPPERWVWLPESATIRVGRRTSVEFIASKNEADDEPNYLEPAKVQPPGTTTRTGSSRQSVSISGPVPVTAVAPATARQAGSRGKRTTETTAPGSDVQSRPKKAGADRGEKKSRTLARFITDGPGDPLVKLGEDGHLPELSLHEAQAGEKQDARPKESNSTMLLLVLGVSFGLTILMLLMDDGSFGNSQESKDSARREIIAYYGAEGDTLKPYQEHLREARRARSRRDFDAERKEYRVVLSLLRSEAKDKLNKYTGLTGRIDYEESSSNKMSDKRLEELIAILLSE